MTFLYNRNSFKTGRLDINVNSSPLLSAYCRLVSIEILLKEHLRANGVIVINNHDVPTMLNQWAGMLTAKNSGTVSSYQVQLAGALKKLWCEGRDRVIRCPKNSYPHIRYVRISSDFPNQCSSEVDVKHLEKLTQQIQNFLLSETGAAA